MAESRVDVHIQNPAGKNRSNMTAKQIKFFGTKRQKAALKAKRKNKARHSSAKKRHRTATKRNAAPKKHRRASTHRHSAKKRRKSSAKSHRPRTVKRKNLGSELVAFISGNPARRRKHKVAHSKKRRKSSSASHRRNAGSRRKHHRHSSRRRGNPAGIPLKDYAYGGVGVLAGFFGSAAIPQMFLGTGNTGMMGYAVTAAATIGLSILAHMVFPKQRALTFGVAAGGAANLLRRVITDQTPFGSYLSGSGMGDYMVANWGPPIMTDGLNSSMAAAAGAPAIASSGINMLDYMDVRGGSASRPC